MPLNIDWQQILLHLLNFLILATGLTLLLYKPVKRFMKKREDEYAAREEGTQKALDDAKDKEREYEQKLSDADAEIAEMKKRAAEESEEVRSEKLRAAESEAKKIVDDARAKAKSEHDKIIEGVGDDIRDMVDEMAGKVALSSSVDEAYESFLKAAEEGEKHEKK